MRVRDVIWDKLVELFEEPTNAVSRGRLNKAVALLRESGATPEELERRYLCWPLHYPGATLTAMALASRWDELGRPPLRANPDDVARVEAELVRRERRRQAALLDADAPGLEAGR